MYNTVLHFPALLVWQDFHRKWGISIDCFLSWILFGGTISLWKGNISVAIQLVNDFFLTKRCFSFEEVIKSPPGQKWNKQTFMIPKIKFCVDLNLSASRSLENSFTFESFFLGKISSHLILTKRPFLGMLTYGTVQFWCKKFLSKKMIQGRYS